MPKVNTFSPEPFVNEIKQTINPGDSVVYVATGYGHSVSVNTGVFEGVYRNSRNNVVGTKIGKVSQFSYNRVYSPAGQHPEYEGRYVTDPRGYRRYESFETGRRYDLVPIESYRTAKLQRNRVFKIDTKLTEASKLID